MQPFSIPLVCIVRSSKITSGLGGGCPFCPKNVPRLCNRTCDTGRHCSHFLAWTAGAGREWGLDFEAVALRGLFLRVLCCAKFMGICRHGVLFLVLLTPMPPPGPGSWSFLSQGKKGLPFLQSERRRLLLIPNAGPRQPKAC